MDDDEERRSDTKETHGDGAPEDASNQQGEEAPGPQGGGGGSGGDEPKAGGEGGRPGNPGGASEFSQATGHPQNAG
jgi:hypothetical protein